MGQAPSCDPIAPVDVNHSDVFAVVCQNKPGKFYVIGVKKSDPIIQAICASIKQFTNQEPEAQTTENWCTTIRVRGLGIGKKMIDLRLELCYTEIFRNLHKIGYKPLMSTRSTGFSYVSNFQMFERTNVPAPESLAMVSLSSFDKFQIVSEHTNHDELVNSVHDMMNQYWENTSDVTDKPNTILPSWRVSEVNLGSDVWGAHSGEAATRARYLLAGLSAELGNESEWKLYTTANIDGSNDYLWFYNTAKVINTAQGSRRISIARAAPPPEYFSRSTGLYGYNGSLLAETSPVTLSLFSPNKLRISGCNLTTELVAVIRNAFNDSGLPIEREDSETYAAIGNGHEFTVQGSPFNCSDEQSVRVSVVFMKVFEEVRKNGYRVLASLNRSKECPTKSFVFVPCDRFGDEGEIRSLVVSTTGVNKMKIIGDYSNRDLQGLLKVVNTFPDGSEDQEQLSVDNTSITEWNEIWRCHHIEFSGKPWASWQGNDWMGSGKYESLGGHTAMMLINMLHVLRHQGWELVCQADCSGEYGSTGKEQPEWTTDDWFFAKVESGEKTRRSVV